MKGFQIASGSTIGRNHIRIGLNNQDSLCYYEDEDQIIAVVCDGCSAGSFSEVGSRVGARIIVDELIKADFWARSGDRQEVEALLDRCKKNICERLAKVVMAMDGNATDDVCEYLLFTIVGAIVLKNYTYIFSIGDGYYSMGVEDREWMGVQSLGPFEGNAPPYIAYNLISDLVTIKDDDLNFKLLDIAPTSKVTYVLLATDGLEDLIKNRSNLIPGSKDDVVGDASQFWMQDKFFRNPVAIERRLRLINRDSTKINRENGSVKTYKGYLGDDTTMIVIRSTTKNDSLSEREEDQSESQ